MVERTRSQKDVKRVREVMQRKVVTIAPGASLLLAARRMREHNIGCLPVLEGGELLGMITDRDLVVRAFAESGDLAQLLTSEISRRPNAHRAPPLTRSTAELQADCGAKVFLTLRKVAKPSHCQVAPNCKGLAQ